jgi:predicted NAD/FAD-dependent oxidoreductase
MNALGKFLAEGLEVRRESKLVKVQREFGVWELTIENQPAWRVGRLVLAAPLPQSLALAWRSPSP